MKYVDAEFVANQRQAALRAGRRRELPCAPRSARSTRRRRQDFAGHVMRALFVKNSKSHLLPNVLVHDERLHQVQCPEPMNMEHYLHKSERARKVMISGSKSFKK